jgi:hypothetical protein
MSGEHNVRFFLRKHKIEEKPAYISQILEVAKHSNHLLSEEDVRRIVTVMGHRMETSGEASMNELAKEKGNL